MARPSEQEKLLQSINREMKEQNQRLINLDDISQESKVKEDRRPVKSVKPTLFVTGKRASQSDYIAARGAIATEKYTKAYLADLKKTAEKTKKQKGVDKKEKEKRVKQEQKDLERQLDISNQMLDMLEIGVAHDKGVNVDDIKREKALAVQKRKQREQEDKDAKAKEKRNQGMFRNMFDALEDKVTSSATEYRDQLEEQFFLGSKERREYEKEQKQFAKDELDRVRDMVLNSQQDQMTYADKQLAKLIEENDNSTEIQGLTKGVEGFDIHVVQAIMKTSDEESKLQAEFSAKNGQSVEDFREEQRKAMDELNKGSKEYRLWMIKNKEKVQDSQDYSIKLSEVQNDLAQQAKRKIEEESKYNRGYQGKFLEIAQGTKDNVFGLKEESERSSEELKNSIDGMNDSIKEQTKLQKTINEDQKAEKRDNVIKEANKVRRDEDVLDTLEEISENTESKPEKIQKLPKKDEGGFLSTILGFLPMLLPLIMSYGPVKALFGKLGKVGSLIMKVGTMFSKFSLGSMAMEGAGSIFDSMGFGGSGSKSSSKSHAKGKKGLIGKIFGGAKSMAKGAMGAVSGIVPSFAKDIVGKGAEKGLAKGAGKGIGKSLLKKIPGVGALAGALFAGQRVMSGDFLGAGGELLSGIAGMIPGLGTAASVGIDGWLMARDAGMTGGKNTNKSNAKSPSKKGGMLGTVAKLAFPALALGSMLDFSDNKESRVIPSAIPSNNPTSTGKKIEMLNGVVMSVDNPQQISMGQGNQINGAMVIGPKPEEMDSRALASENTLNKILETIQANKKTEATKRRSERASENGKVSPETKEKSWWEKAKSFMGFGSSGGSGGSTTVSPVVNTGPGQYSGSNRGNAGTFDGPTSKLDNFKKLDENATIAAKELGIPKELIIAQQIQENGWKKKKLTGENNYFNIKAGKSWKGRKSKHRVWEVENGKKVWKDQWFRDYDNSEDSAKDYAKLLKGNSRYAGALQEGLTPEQRAVALQKGGYATDPNYAKNIISIMHGKTFNSMMNTVSGSPKSKLSTPSGTSSTASAYSAGPVKSPSTQATQTGVGTSSPGSGGGVIGLARKYASEYHPYSMAKRGQGAYLDCSLFIQKVIKESGIDPNLPGTTRTQVPYLNGKAQSGGGVQRLGGTGELQSGDLVYFMGRHHHVVMMTSNNTFVHSSSTKNTVQERPVGNYFNNMQPTDLFRYTGAVAAEGAVSANQMASTLSTQTGVGAGGSGYSPGNGGGNATQTGVGGAGGAGGAGGVGGSSSAMVDGSVTALADGSSSHELNGTMKSAIGVAGKLAAGNIPGLEGMPFGNLLQKVAGGKGNFAKSLLSSNSMISQGLDGIKGAIPNSVGQYIGGQIPFSGKIEDDTMKFLSGFFAGK